MKSPESDRNYNCSPNFGHPLFKSSSAAAMMLNRRAPVIIKKLTSCDLSTKQSDMRAYRIAYRNEGQSENQNYLGIPSQRSMVSSNVQTATAKSARGNCHLWDTHKRTTSSAAGDGSMVDHRLLNIYHQKRLSNVSTKLSMKTEQRGDKGVILISSDKMMQTDD